MTYYIIKLAIIFAIQTVSYALSRWIGEVPDAWMIGHVVGFGLALFITLDPHARN